MRETSATHISLDLRRNFSSLLAAQVWHKGCMFLVAVGLAHTIGSAALGRLLSVISFVWIFWMLIDAGLSELFIRDVAFQRSLFATYANFFLRLKAFLAVAALLLMTLIAGWYAPMRDEVVLVILFGLALIAESYATLFRAVFRIQERMHWEAALWAIDGAFKLCAVGVVLWRVPGVDPVLTISISWLAVSLLGCGVAAWSVRRWWPTVVIGTDYRAWPAILQRSIPFVLVYGFSLLSLRSMIFLVSIFRGHFDAGQFGAGERILEGLLVLPIAVAQVLLPVSARLGATSRAELRRITLRALLGLFCCGLAIAMVLTAWGPWLVTRVYGKGFASTGSLMLLLGWIAIPLFLKPVVEKILSGLHRQGIVWKWYLMAMLGNVAVAFAVVPSYGLTGAAGCLLASESLCILGLSWVLWRSLDRLVPESTPSSLVPSELSVRAVVGEANTPSIVDPRIQPTHNDSGIGGRWARQDPDAVADPIPST